MKNKEYNFTEEQIYNETDEYVRMNKDTYGLPVDILADESFTCFFNKHPLVVFFRNSYNPHVHNYVPVSVCKNPCIVFDKKINLYKKDILKILEWVRIYRDYLYSLAHKEIDTTYFYNHVAVNKKAKLISESTHISYIPIYEMAVIQKNITGLNWDIWVDDDELYKKGGHAMRIKVQNYDKSIDTRQWNPFILHSGMFSKDVKDTYTYSDRCGFSTFVNANYDLLKDLANKKIELSIFKEKLNKVHKISGSNWEVEYSDTKKEPPYVFAYNIKNNYDVVYSADKEGYNILTPNGTLLMDDWVMYIEQKCLYDLIDMKKTLYFLVHTKDEHLYKVYDNGKLIKIK